MQATRKQKRGLKQTQVIENYRLVTEGISDTFLIITQNIDDAKDSLRI